MIDFVLEISYATDPRIDDQVQSRLFLSASTGSFSSDAAGVTTVSAFFDSAADRADAARSLEITGVRVREDDRERVDWLDRYEQSLEPLRIGRSFVVAPDARLIAADEERHRLVVPQEQAFGTGSHETTSLCIEMLESIDMRNKRGLDVGSGSGILGMAMLRLGASKVMAFDNDLDAYGPLRDNTIRNQAGMALYIGGIEALRGGLFDVITMNIVPEVIIPLLPDVIEHMRGNLILSGILTTRRGEVVDRAGDAGLTLRGEAGKGEWWCGQFQRRVAIGL